MTCPDCEYNKARAANWRAEAYKLGGHDYIPKIGISLDDEDWRQIWAEFDDSDVDLDFQEYMAKKHGEGYYTDPDGYWRFQQQVIKEMVNAKLKEKNT